MKAPSLFANQTTASDNFKFIGVTLNHGQYHVGGAIGREYNIYLHQGIDIINKTEVLTQSQKLSPIISQLLRRICAKPLWSGWERVLGIANGFQVVEKKGCLIQELFNYPQNQFNFMEEFNLILFLTMEYLLKLRNFNVNIYCHDAAAIHIALNENGQIPAIVPLNYHSLIYLFQSAKQKQRRTSICKKIAPKPLKKAGLVNQKYQEPSEKNDLSILLQNIGTIQNIFSNNRPNFKNGLYKQQIQKLTSFLISQELEMSVPSNWLYAIQITASQKGMRSLKDLKLALSKNIQYCKNMTKLKIQAHLNSLATQNVASGELELMKSSQENIYESSYSNSTQQISNQFDCQQIKQKIVKHNLSPKPIFFKY